MRNESLRLPQFTSLFRSPIDYRFHSETQWVDHKHCRSVYYHSWTCMVAWTCFIIATSIILNSSCSAPVPTVLLSTCHLYVWAHCCAPRCFMIMLSVHATAACASACTGEGETRICFTPISRNEFVLRLIKSWSRARCKIDRNKTLTQTTQQRASKLPAASTICVPLAWSWLVIGMSQTHRERESYLAGLRLARSPSSDLDLRTMRDSCCQINNWHSKSTTRSRAKPRCCLPCYFFFCRSIVSRCAAWMRSSHACCRKPQAYLSTCSTGASHVSAWASSRGQPTSVCLIVDGCPPSQSCLPASNRVRRTFCALNGLPLFPSSRCLGSWEYPTSQLANVDGESRRESRVEHRTVLFRSSRAASKLRGRTRRRTRHWSFRSGVLLSDVGTPQEPSPPFFLSFSVCSSLPDPRL